MGIFDALTNAVSGLQAQSFALGNISGNIANSSTTAYKRTETSFQDLLVDTGSANTRAQRAGSVLAFSRATNDVQGTVSAATSGTSIAIDGDGFFLVQSPTGSVNGNMTFSGTNLYTRRGDFELDRTGHLYNGAGYYLMGRAVSTTGAVSSTPSVIDISDASPYPAVKTTSVTYRANLPSTPQTENYVEGDAASALLDSSYGATISADDQTGFLASSISGGSVPVYDANGASKDLQLRWGKTSNSDTDGATSDVWSLYYLSNSTATGSDAAWTQVDADPSASGTQGYIFENGVMTKPASGKTAIADLKIDGVSFGDVKIDHGTGMTQYADSDGTVSTSKLAQDGVASGEMTALSINDGGSLVATYSNGRTRTLYELPLATFASTNQLKALDGGAFSATEASGEATLGGGASILGNAIEASNVDISDEFTKMIVTQQAYSANTRVVSTANDMMQETLSMIR